MIKITEPINADIFGNHENDEEMPAPDLEGTIEDSFKQPSKFSKWAVDTFAGQSFHQPLFSLIELSMMYFGSMDLYQSLHARRNAFFIGLFSNRVYGIFGDYWTKLWKANDESSEIKQRLVDGSGKLIFEAGLYAGNLAINGINAEDICIAVPLGLLMHFGLGREYRKYQAHVRNYFGIKP